jgi:hypothetical protein
MDNMEGELNRRLAVLAVLYHKRRANTNMPEVSLAEIEERMGFPRDYLDFTLWYLQRKGYVVKADNAQYAMTAEGVDFVEAQRVDFPTLNKMLTAGSEPSADEVAQANLEAEATPAPDPQASRSESASPSGTIVLPSSMEMTYDRRFTRAERRVGAPDLRKFKAERRIGVRDRRTIPNGPPTNNR